MILQHLTPRLLLASLCTLMGALSVACARTSPTETQAAIWQEILDQNKDGARQIAGTEPEWYFLRQEIEHLAQGAFWEQEHEGALSAETSPSQVIATYSQELHELGVELILVPVPPKAALYSDKIGATEAAIIDPAPFYEKLISSGVKVLDVETLLKTAASESEAPLYCRSDSHWSPRAGEIIAKAITDQYGKADWAIAAKNNYNPNEKFKQSAATTLSLVGDLVPDEIKENTAKESLPIRYISNGDDTQNTIEVDSKSPVLLVGDSHNLVFNQGVAREMHAQGAGVFDHLSYQFGFPLDRIAVRGSGSSAARGDVARRAFKDKEFLKSKKLLIWLFSAREFTQEKWKHIPAQP